MRNRTKNYKLMPSLLMAGALLLAGCTNNDYDFDKVDLTMGFGGETLTIPSSSTTEIPLADILELKEDGSVTTDAEGNYLFSLNGQGDAAHPKVNPIELRGSSQNPNFQVDLLSDRGARAKRAAQSFSTEPLLVFEYHGNSPEVKSITEADVTGFVTTIQLNLKSLKDIVPNIEELTLTIPSYLQINSLNGNGNGTPNIMGNKIVVRNVTAANDFKLTIKANKLDFTQEQDEYGHLTIDKNTGKIDLEGYFSLAIKGTVTGLPTTSTYTIASNISVSNMTVNSAKGKFDPDINLNNLGEVQVKDIPDFLDDDNVVTDLDNPRIILTISNDMKVAAKVSGDLIALNKEGREIAHVQLPKMDIHRTTTNDATTTNICICRHATPELTSEYGNDLYVVDNLSTLIQRIPDKIKFTNVEAKANQDVEAEFLFNHQYNVNPSYKVEAPLAFAENANIVYKKSMNDWNDDVKDLDLAEGAYVELTTNVENKMPAYLNIEATPIDANGNSLADKLAIEIPNKVIAASADGNTPANTNVTIKISPKTKQALKLLDGIEFVMSGSAATPGQTTITGITLNKNKHSLKLNNINIKIVGKVIGDFN